MEELIIRVLQGRASPEEARRVRAWRAASPENESRYGELVTIWSTLPDVDLETTPPPASLIRERAEKPQTISLAAHRRWRRKKLFGGLAIAAAISSLVLVGRLVDDPPSPVLQIQELVTGTAEPLMTQLSDGTTVYLAPGSRLRVSSTPDVREVELEGRAFFGVAHHGADWPFVVRGPRGTVRVLGTRFELSTEEEDFRVIVVDGTVDFSVEGETVRLQRGQMSVVRADASPTRTPVEDIDALLSWMGSSLVFNETPLAQAAAEIGSRFNAVVTVEGDELARRTVSGGFRDRSFDEIVTAICRVVSAECVIGDRYAVMSPASVEPASGNPPVDLDRGVGATVAQQAEGGSPDSFDVRRGQ